MPNRILREGILTSPRIARLGWAEEVFYRRLMSVVDDFGRYYADPGLLRAACYPRQLSKVSDPDIGKWLHSCAGAGLVRVYEASDSERYLQLLDFRQQTRAKKSKFPQESGTCAADATHTPSTSEADAPVFVFGDGDVIGDEARERAPAVDIPEWMPQEPWAAFVAMRKAKGKRAPFTDAAKAGIIRELSKLRDQGHDPATVLQASVNSGWSGVFAPKGPPPITATVAVNPQIEATKRLLAEQAAAPRADPDIAAAGRAKLRELTNRMRVA